METPFPSLQELAFTTILRTAEPENAAAVIYSLPPSVLQSILDRFAKKIQRAITKRIGVYRQGELMTTEAMKRNLHIGMEGTGTKYIFTEIGISLKESLKESMCKNNYGNICVEYLKSIIKPIQDIDTDSTNDFLEQILGKYEKFIGDYERFIADPGPLDKGTETEMEFLIDNLKGPIVEKLARFAYVRKPRPARHLPIDNIKREIEQILLGKFAPPQDPDMNDPGRRKLAIRYLIDNLDKPLYDFINEKFEINSNEEYEEPDKTLKDEEREERKERNDILYNKLNKFIVGNNNNIQKMLVEIATILKEKGDTTETAEYIIENLRLPLLKNLVHQYNKGIYNQNSSPIKNITAILDRIKTIIETIFKDILKKNKVTAIEVITNYIERDLLIKLYNQIYGVAHVVEDIIYQSRHKTKQDGTTSAGRKSGKRSIRKRSIRKRSIRKRSIRKRPVRKRSIRKRSIRKRSIKKRSIKKRSIKKEQ